MAKERVQRRLAAILAADVVGYSRLMGEDETGTRARFNAHLNELFEPKVASQQGRIVKTTGDGLLIEFNSVVDAVQCAIDVQQGMTERNASVAGDQRIEFRIGVHLGDVIVEGDDIHGDGVNVAARLEGLAETGGICISGLVQQSIEGKIDVAFDDQGEQTVKNIARPVRVYRVTSAAANPVVDVSAPVAGFGGRPAIAVLPFDNLSGDPEQEFFVDGLTEDLILRLSYWRWFPVIARNSTFVFKGQAVDIQEVGEKLGARYVVEGSVRKSGNRIRVAAQLIDATNGHHVWAERYDRDLEDVFAVQDEITDKIVGALEPVIGEAEQHRAHIGHPENLDAWETCQRAFWHFYRVNQQDQGLAKDWFRKSVETDPEFSMAWGGLSIAYYTDLVSGWTKDVGGTIDEMRTAGQRAVAISDQVALGHFGVGFAHVFSDRHDAGIQEMERGIENNPSFAQGYYLISMAQMFAGQPEKAIESIGRALRLSPRDFQIARMLSAAAMAHAMAGQNETAVEFGENAVARAPENPLAHRNLAIPLTNLGRMDEAKAALSNLLRLIPDYSVEKFGTTMPFKDLEDLERAVAGLRELGLPE